jgi:hypothetical protein
MYVFTYDSMVHGDTADKHACIIGIEAVRAYRIVSVHIVWWYGATKQHPGLLGPWVWMVTREWAEGCGLPVCLR